MTVADSKNDTLLSRKYSLEPFYTESNQYGESIPSAIFDGFQTQFLLDRRVH